MIAATVRVLLAVVLIALPSHAQEQTEGKLKIAPTISITKLFPGPDIVYDYLVATSWPSYPLKIRYQGTGLAFSARGFSASLQPLALYISGGVQWFSRTDEPPDYHVMPAAAGTGEALAPGDFMSFPLAVGVQLAFPYLEQEKLMGFVGVHGTANFVSGDVEIDQQIKFGYELVGGFAVRVFECGIRYSAFSDMKNLGVYLGFRLNSFAL